MQPLRLGVVRYLNTAPLIAGLDRTRGVELVPEAPSAVVGLLRSGRVDVGLVSLVDLVRSPEPLRPLGCGMIGCDGPTLTVGVFSRVPLARAARLHADRESSTSVILARLALRATAGAEPEPVPFDAAGWRAGAGDRPGDDHGAGPAGGPETVLLIGDKVVTAEPPADRYPHRLDLGEAWHAMTGLPFVYAVWACREADAGSGRAEAAEALLDRQRRRNAARLDAIAAAAARRHGWPAGVARRYLGGLLRYGLDARAREGADRFVAMAGDAGWLAGGPIRWPTGLGAAEISAGSAAGGAAGSAAG